MLKHTEIKKGRLIVLNNDPYEVIDYSHKVKGRGSSVVQTRLKNMRTGRVLQKSFHPGDEVEEAEIEKLEARFVYANRGKCVFHKEGDPSKRFILSKEQIEDKLDYLVSNTLVTALLFEEKIIGISIPVKINLKVKEAPPGIKGNSAEGGTKTVTLETGKVINTPLFIKEGDVVEVNTETGEYVRRAKE